MNEQQLRDYLDELDQAIEDSGASADDKERLGELIASIELQLGPTALADEEESLVDQVDTLVSNFESEHPTISGILNNIMMTLSSMGV